MRKKSRAQYFFFSTIENMPLAKHSKLNHEDSPHPPLRNLIYPAIAPPLAEHSEALVTMHQPSQQQSNANLATTTSFLHQHRASGHAIGTKKL